MAKLKRTEERKIIIDQILKKQGFDQIPESEEKGILGMIEGDMNALRVVEVIEQLDCLSTDRLREILEMERVE